MDDRRDHLVFKALADGTRRKMLDVVKRRPGITVGELCAEFKMTRTGAMKHLGILESAMLMVSETDANDGRSRRLFLNAVPIQRIHERWTNEFSAHFAGGLEALKRQLERKKQ